MRKKAYVLKEDFNFFGKKIPKGTVYRPTKDSDYFCPHILREGILMTCPNYNLHFTVVMNNEFFIEIYF